MEIRKIPLSLVIPSPMNPRKTFDEDELRELADNIEKQGLLQPVTVRPVTGKTSFAVMQGNADFHPEYEIVCGERRYRAFASLSEKWSVMDAVAPDGESFNRFDEIPAIVREMSDEEAFEAMITENLQRKDVDPMEEAYAFGQLMDRGKTAEEIALRFGKSVRFIQDRVKLNTLIPELALAVREDRMPISSALIVSKLDADGQRDFLRRAQNYSDGFSKRSAESFVYDRFMMLDKAPWSREFEGGCGWICSSCHYNTANAGCLFWEMKPEGLGKCTSREGFESKSVAWIISRLEGIGDKLVKKGATMDYGKVVIELNNGSYDHEDTKRMKGLLQSAIDAKGWETVNTDKVFKGKCWYKADDERTIEGLQNGTLYRVISLFSYTTMRYEEQYHWLRTPGANASIGTAKVDPTELPNGMPVEVVNLLDKLRLDRRSYDCSRSAKGAEALAGLDKYSSEPLQDFERELMLSFMLIGNNALCLAVGINLSDVYAVDSIHKFVREHPEKWGEIMHGWICQKLKEDNRCLILGERYLPSLAELHGSGKYRAEMKKIEDKQRMSEAKIGKELAGYGYDMEGGKLTKDETEVSETFSGQSPYPEQYKEMKSRHPEAILLFRVGDFYELYDEDAEKAAEILKIAVFKRTIDGVAVNVAGFPSHALDTYLPKIVRSGNRVAICEQQQDPKKR